MKVPAGVDKETATYLRVLEARVLELEKRVLTMQNQPTVTEEPPRMLPAPYVFDAVVSSSDGFAVYNADTLSYWTITITGAGGTIGTTDTLSAIPH